MLRDILEGFSYEQFKGHQANWLNSGRQVWGFFGNISKDEALATVKTAQAQMHLKSVSRDELDDFRVIKLSGADSHRIDIDVVDETNDNSALVSSFQAGMVDAHDIKASMLLSITHQYLEEATFNQLRTIEQLGYVVFTKVLTVRDVHGLNFLVQSPTKGCSYLRNSLDKHLLNMIEKAASISDEEFATMVKAVLVGIEEQDKNLSEEVSRFFKSEIAIHRYHFDR